ncbi:class I SAM-dependent methyltransferase [Methylobacterium sp. WL64]|uniref:class I SAM-dependent methyltransferase n=1 Tax=Methylobacterium sp. WL64 TaxID=2603894 RepID=UPI0011CB5F2A|nr:class I SAM-dependent methyltransferase [Methylobacterium sp. WL64]TXN01540.1 class I SAM-dependent methyltransferase [Methylobacterium sp. WL64]
MGSEHAADLESADVSTLPEGFDEAAYLEAHPDVRAAVAAGDLGSGADHFRYFGHKEGRAIRRAPPFEDTELLIGNDGLPIPPSDLMFLVTNGRDPARFQAAGEADLRAVRRAVEEAGLVLSKPDLRVLDWGCGCGRLARHWASEADSVRLHGCDINPELVDWCAASLPFGQFAVSPFDPPLAYADGSFDLIYGISVLTHLTFEEHYRWMQELYRLLVPGGIAVMTGHGPTMFPQVLAGAAPTSAAGGRVRTTLIDQEAFICLENSAGSNASGNVLTQNMFAHIFSPFDVRLQRPRYGLMGIHDTYVFVPKTDRSLQFIDFCASFDLSGQISEHSFELDFNEQANLSALINLENLHYPATIQVTLHALDGSEGLIATWTAPLPGRTEWTLIDQAYTFFMLEGLPAYNGLVRATLKVQGTHALDGTTLSFRKVVLF